MCTAQQESNTDSFSQPGFEFPKIQDITSTIEKVKDYYVRSTEYRIVATKTGAEMKDFDAVNPNGGNDVSKNGFTNWDYTIVKRNTSY